MPPAATKVLTAHVPLRLAEKIDQVVVRVERSRLTRKALDDVDAGRVIDHQAVQAWADSLSTADRLPVPR